MDFWGKKIDVSREAAARQIAIINTFPSQKRLGLALEFANMGVDRTFDWIRSRHPEFSELELRLEFVRLLSYESGKISEDHWQHFKSVMEERIKKDWSERFRKMMAARNWTYDDVAKLGRFKNGKVIEATVSRGLRAFAKLAVMVFEEGRKEIDEKLPDLT